VFCFILRVKRRGYAVNESAKFPFLIRYFFPSKPIPIEQGMGIPSGRLHVAEIQERQMSEKRFVLEIHGNNERKLSFLCSQIFNLTNVPDDVFLAFDTALERETWAQTLRRHLEEVKAEQLPIQLSSAGKRLVVKKPEPLFADLLTASDREELFESVDCIDADECTEPLLVRVVSCRNVPKDKALSYFCVLR
jgi:hypothetical protein